MMIFTPTYRDLATFFMHAEQMEKTGVPLRQMLQAAADDSGHRAISRACFWMLHDVQSGKTLSEAMEQHPRIFNGVMVSLVAMGEKTGRMAKALGKCFDHCVQMEQFQANMRRATRNFKFSGLVILALMLVAGKTFAPVAATVVLLCAVSLVLLYRFAAGMRKFCDYLFVVTPALGDFIRDLEMARFTETLALYYDAGVPLLDALSTATQRVQNRSMQEVLLRAGRRAAAGERMADAFQSVPRVDHLFLVMLTTGEKSGNLTHTMQEAALYYRAQMENALDRLQKIVGPMLAVLLGWLVYVTYV